MVQPMTDNFWQIEARSEETRKFIKNIKRLTRRKFTAEEKIRIVPKCFVGMFRSISRYGECLKSQAYQRDAGTIVSAVIYSLRASGTSASVVITPSTSMSAMSSSE